MHFNYTKEVLLKGKTLGLYPSLAVSLFNPHEEVFKFFIESDVDSVFDLASLTKPFVTGTMLLLLEEKKKLQLENSIGEFLPFVSDELKGVPLHQFLNHSSGLNWHESWFENAREEFGGARSLRRASLAERRAFYQHRFKKISLVYQPGEKTLYSDLGYWLLGWVLEEVLGKRLDRISKEFLFCPLGLESIQFFPHDEKIDSEERARILPTENCPWRGPLRGEVHDDNAWAMGGVAGHAGLFSNLQSVVSLGRAFLKRELLGISKERLCWSQTREILPKGTDRTPLWVFPTPPNSSSGQYFSLESFGHTGFTGTSLWIDPVKELGVALLTNRVYPSREERGFKEYRGEIHNALVQDWEEVHR